MYTRLNYFGLSHTKPSERLLHAAGQQHILTEAWSSSETQRRALQQTVWPWSPIMESMWDHMKKQRTLRWAKLLHDAAKLPPAAGGELVQSSCADSKLKGHNLIYTDAYYQQHTSAHTHTHTSWQLPQGLQTSPPPPPYHQLIINAYCIVADRQPIPGLIGCLSDFVFVLFVSLPFNQPTLIAI